MVKVIMGLKGSGKTKQLVKDINEAVQSETGSVVCVEFGKKLTYDIDYRVRLIDAKEYNITDVPLLKGFLSGLHRATGEAFVTWCEEFGAANDMRFTITISDEPEQASEAMKKYL